jgi:hypothetical protein
MPRAALAPLALAAAAAATAPACEREPPAAAAAAGPAYTPATANLLKALADRCEVRPGPEGGETRDCRGRQSKVRIEIDRARRIRELDMMVLAATGVWEAWTRYEAVLPAVVGQAITDTARKKLRGDPTEDVVEGARVTTLIDGERYTVKLTWGR